MNQKETIHEPTQEYWRHHSHLAYKRVIYIVPFANLNIRIVEVPSSLLAYISLTGAWSIKENCIKTCWNQSSHISTIHDRHLQNFDVLKFKKFAMRNTRFFFEKWNYLDESEKRTCQKESVTLR